MILLQYFLDVYAIISNICNIFHLKSGVIKAFGSEKEVASVLKACHFETIYDADGGCVIPGLIDGHTHPVWAGDRVHEFAMKVSLNIFYFILAITYDPVKSTRKRIIYRPKCF